MKLTQLMLIIHGSNSCCKIENVRSIYQLMIFYNLLYALIIILHLVLQSDETSLWIQAF